MWDLNPRALLHHDLVQEPGPGEEYSEPQRGPVTTWVILLGVYRFHEIK